VVEEREIECGQSQAALPGGPRAGPETAGLEQAGGEREDLVRGAREEGKNQMDPRW
jgi:hypothetical protein